MSPSQPAGHLRRVSLLTVLVLSGLASIARGQLINVSITVDSRIDPKSGLPSGIVTDQVYTAYVVTQVGSPPQAVTLEVPNSKGPGVPGVFTFTTLVGDDFHVECTAVLTVPVFIWPLGFTTLTYDVNAQKAWTVKLQPLGNGGIPLMDILDLHE